MTATTAILMIDVQKMYLEQARRDVLGWPPIWRLSEVVGECRQLLAAARTAGLPVIYTRSVHRPDGADVTPRMRRLLASVTRDGTTPLPGRSGTSADIMHEVAPEPGDIVIDKLRWDAFQVAPWRELIAPDAPWNRAFTTPGYGRSKPPGPP